MRYKMPLWLTAKKRNASLACGKIETPGPGEEVKVFATKMCPFVRPHHEINKYFFNLAFYRVVVVAESKGEVYAVRNAPLGCGKGKKCSFGLRQNRDTCITIMLSAVYSGPPLALAFSGIILIIDCPVADNLSQLTL